MFEQMLNSLVRTAVSSAINQGTRGLGGGGFGLRPQRQQHSRNQQSSNAGGGLGGSLMKMAASPQGMTLLAGLAVAAYESFAKPKTAVAATEPPPPATGAGWSGNVQPPPMRAPTMAATQQTQMPPPLPSGNWNFGAAPANPDPAPAGGWHFGTQPQSAPTPPAFGGWSFGGAAAAAPVAAAPAAAASAADEKARFLVLCMIAAAQSDGAIDETERTVILDGLNKVDADGSLHSALGGLLNQPVDLAALARIAAADPQAAMEGYLAALIAIAPDTPAETEFLRHMAYAFRLDPGLVQQLHAQVGR